MSKRIAILGSTGSVGTQALDVIAHHRDEFTPVALAAGKNTELLSEQVATFKPEIATTAADGPDGLMRAALDSKPDIILAATDGFVSFDAIFAAVERGIDIAVANKELIVSAGELLVAAAKKSGSKILPVDSEHSAIFQCLIGESLANVEQIILTASGGPFRTWTKEQIENATVEEALNHPTWRMGPKNTIDSATLMNKGLEIIEAAHLFPIPNVTNYKNHYAVLIHPKSIIHGLVAFKDGSVKSQLSPPDMRTPIGYALAYPTRLSTVPKPPATSLRPSGIRSGNVGPTTGAMDGGREDGEQDGSMSPLTGCAPGATADKRERSLEGGANSGFQSGYLTAEGALALAPPDAEKFPCLGLAYRALTEGGIKPAVLSAANEVAVSAFLAGRIPFGRIPMLIEKVLGMVPQGELTLASVRTADRAARSYAENETR